MNVHELLPFLYLQWILKFFILGSLQWYFVLSNVFSYLQFTLSIGDIYCLTWCAQSMNLQFLTIQFVSDVLWRLMDLSFGSLFLCFYFLTQVAMHFFLWLLSWLYLPAAWCGVRLLRLIILIPLHENINAGFLYISLKCWDLISDRSNCLNLWIQVSMMHGRHRDMYVYCAEIDCVLTWVFIIEVFNTKFTLCCPWYAVGMQLLWHQCNESGKI